MELSARTVKSVHGRGGKNGLLSFILGLCLSQFIAVVYDMLIAEPSSLMLSVVVSLFPVVCNFS